MEFASFISGHLQLRLGNFLCAMIIESGESPLLVGAIRRLLSEYQTGLSVDLCFQGFEEELAALPGAYAPPRGNLLLAMRDDEALGCVGVRPLDAGRCEMKRLYVRPAGRGQGLGRQLAERAIAFARAAGYREMVLDTLPQMVEAQRLYAVLGFTECAAYYENPLPGVRYLRLKLEKAGQ